MKNIWLTVFCFSCLLINAQITTFPYLEDFETGPAWTAFTAATSTNPASSDWAWGTPNHTYVIKTAGNGNKCWCAGGLSGAFYNNWEQSYVKSPVFNFTNLLYPHIKFKLFYDCEYHFDGGNLQYSINGGATWNDVGTVGGTAASPIPETNDCNTQNWYNYPSINYLNNPAGFVTSKHGWCGNTQNGGVGWDPASAGTNCVGGNGPGHWITAEHCLTGCAGQPNVILRFTFGSGFSCNNFDGFAFDSVGISNGVPNSADFISTCGLGNTINFTSTFAPCPQTNAWSWNFGDPSSGATNTVTTQNASHTFSGPGTYTVVLIAKGGACNPPDTITKVVQVMSAAVTSYTNVSCFGGTNGAAVATVSLGILPLTYAWSPSGGSATTAAGLAAGNYSFTVTDANGCQKTSTVAITQPPAIVASITPSNITCNGLANGTATLTASGGVAPLNYTWSPIGGNGITATALNAGNFTTTVTDANTCTKTVTFSITQPAAINTSVLSTDPLCAALGSATITASGGTGALSYSWSPSGGNNNIASGLSGGNYSVTITDANNCSKTETVTLSQSGSFTIAVTSTNVLCFGGNNGSASSIITGATSPYTYTWAPSGGNSAIASSLTAGNYTLSVADVNGCIGTKIIAISQPSVIIASEASNSITCNGLSNGSATITASGGVAPLTYSWSPSGGSAVTASGLNIGNYTTTVTDANACSKTVTFSITQPTTISSSALVTNPICGNPGSASVTATGGTGTLSYSWSPMGGINNIAGGLSGGNYSVSITDGNTCVKTQTLTLIQSSSFTTAITSSNVSCFGGNNGSATAVITGTSIPYTYTWSPVGGNMATANSLTAGNYTLSVNDVNGCAESSTVTIIQPTAVLSSITSATICSGQQATLTSTVSGGTAPYIYSWQPSGSTNASISVTPALTSSYTLNVIDNNNCNASPAISQITVLPPLGLSVTGPFTICANSTVAINASATGGNGNYQYTWLPGNLVGSSISSNIASNTQYTVIVNDGCTALPAQALTQVNVIPSPTINIQHTSISGCPTLCSTFYDSTLVASGIVSSWNWMFSDGQSSSSSSAYVCFTKSGVYSGTLIVTTNNGCTTTPSVLSNITVYIVPTPDFTSSTFDGNMFNAPFVLNNTSTNYNSIKWITTLGNFTSNSINLNYQDEGLYPVTLIATNNFGCKDSITKTIKVEPIFTFYAPNSFTPNDNGLNDTFLPMGTGWDPTSYTLLIFDRWGVQIFNTNDVNQGWDGTYKGLGEIVQVDVYTWKVDLKDVFHKQHNYIGHVTVLK